MCVCVSLNIFLLYLQSIKIDPALMVLLAWQGTGKRLRQGVGDPSAIHLPLPVDGSPLWLRGACHPLWAD